MTSEEPCYHFEHIHSEEGVDEYEFVPHDNYPGIDEQRRLCKMYDEILEKIPINISLETGEVPGKFRDYPPTTVEQFKSMLGKSGKKKLNDPRYLVVLGNYAFFRRYTIDSDSAIMYHYLDFHTYGYGLCPNNNIIEDLYNLLGTKMAADITEQEMKTIIGA